MSKINGLKFSARFFKSLIFSLIAFSFVFMSCNSTDSVAKSSGSSKKMPDWVTGPSASYPKSEWLTATGVSVERKSAEIDAINGLVSIFEQKVTSASQASRRMTMAQKDGTVASSDESSLGQDILREISQDDVIAVEIPEVFESKAEGKWYALAAMKREKGIQIYSAMIEKNQSEINKILTGIKSEKDSNTMQNFSRLDFAEEVSKVNEKYLKRLTVLNSQSAEKFSSITTPVQIHKLKMDMAAKIPVCVQVDEDSDGRIAKAFQEVMTSFGFNTTLGSNERYVISCKNHFTQSASSNEKTKFCEYVSECALNDTYIGETLVPLSITGREGSPNYQNAEVRAKQKITAKIKADFAKSFQEYLGDF